MKHMVRVISYLITSRGLRLAQNSKDKFAITLFGDSFKIGIFELKRMLALNESVKYISSIAYETDDLIWFSGLDGNNDVILKQLGIVRV